MTHRFRYWFGRHQLLGRRGYRRLGILCPACRHGQRAVVGYRLWCWHDHKQAWTRGPFGQRVNVDRDLLPLLRDLWDAGYATQNSCAGGGPDLYYAGYVSFTTTEDLTAALPVARRWIPWAAINQGAIRW